jgi:hypothetical protein
MTVNQQRVVDHDAVERAAADLLRALGADVDAGRSRRRRAGSPTPTHPPGVPGPNHEDKR